MMYTFIPAEEDLESTNSEIEREIIILRKRVIAAHERQRIRFEGSGILFNSQMGAEETGRFCRLPDDVREWFSDALERLDISARSYNKILKVARTIADIAGADDIEKEHLSEAMFLNNSYII